MLRIRPPRNGPFVGHVSIRSANTGVRMVTRATSSVQTITEGKKKLLDAIAPLSRGVLASGDDQAAIDKLAQELETINPNPKSLASPLVNGKWKLVYTTSESILGTNRPPPLRPSGPIFQTIDAVNLKARNQETWPFFNQVAADLTALSDSKVAVQFREFKIFGFIPVKAPGSFKGTLDITFVDEEMRISRGDKGNLFVLLMEDPEGKP